MDKINEFISSGVIEMYCMGLTSKEESEQVVHMATLHKAVRDEIQQVNETLCLYVESQQRQPSPLLKEKLLQQIEKQKTVLPLILFQNPSISYWHQYLEENKIAAPADFDPFFLAELPSDEKQYTYVAWAKKGASLEETHDSEDEWLFVLRGTCEMTVNGKVSHYKAGDIITIPHHALHKAEATSDEPMILIGQRIAA